MREVPLERQVVAGEPVSAIGGEVIEVTPPSMSWSPAAAPASRPVTRSLTPLVVVPSCFAPLELVAAGSPRSNRPVVAVSVPWR